MPTAEHLCLFGLDEAWHKQMRWRFLGLKVLASWKRLVQTARAKRALIHLLPPPLRVNEVIAAVAVWLPSVSLCAGRPISLCLGRPSGHPGNHVSESCLG